ncbi:PREDICTED: TITAN-like protein isoform X2 [Tarenaya hassleriana]|uniref:TITAN-like protein isoform X2 n=1 Tax=Tarenaya hassleriana TaxID=28532 RepID=UPI00053C0C0E|nr:PREDICTED: TITAN-like protein isoform X2 [Tarenaya hassleriana]
MEKKKQKKNLSTKKKSEIEFCKVCRLHHDQGPRHKYFPRHKDFLSAFLDRFRAKIADVRFFVRNPSVLRPQEESQNRTWCVFCDEDIVELGSSFACAKAINHLASADHLKNLKHFLWKYGPGMDCIDNFRLSGADVAQWETNCQSLGNEAASSDKGPRGQIYGPTNDIHNKLEFETVDRIEKSLRNHIRSDYSNDVMPLQYNTNEYQIPHSGFPEVAQMHTMGDYLPPCTYTPSDLTGNMFGQHSIPYSSRDYSDSGYGSQEVWQAQKLVEGTHNSSGSLSITCISSSRLEDASGNVHTGAPPPWLDTNDGDVSVVQSNHPATSFVSQANKSGKTRKLNPKRVGAAWAERRKIELEMERRGHVINSDADADWLPNFGRVWQSGTRKESRKEFEKEKPNSVKTESISQAPVRIQPYISKRMRIEDNE